MRYDIPGVPRRVLAAALTEPDIALVTIPSVELIEVGEDWQTMIGPITFDGEDLESAIASQDDPAVRTPVLKLGHVDPRFDGQPSFGKITNLAIQNDVTLVGDYTAIPVWLAKVMASAFPRRSIEGWYNYTSHSGNTWPFILTGCALLGDAYPAIVTLEDIPALFGETVPVMVPAPDIPEVLGSYETDHGFHFVATKGGDDSVKWRRRDNPATEPVLAAGQVMAGVSVDDIRMAFYDSLNPDQYWWWIRQVRISPAELIVDDDEGHLFRVGYTIDTANDTIVFDDPTQVKEEYVDVAAQAAAGHPVRLAGEEFTNPAAASRPRDRLVHAGVSSTPPDAATITPNAPESEGNEVNLSEEALRALGLEPGASDEDINAAITAKVTTTTTTTTETGEESTATTPEGGTPPATETPVAPVTTPTDVPATTGVTVPEGMALVDAATLTEIRTNAAAAAALVETNRRAERDRVISDAVRAGKFPRSRMEHWTTSWEADPEGTRASIASLADNLVPVEEKGTLGGDIDPEVGAYPDTWKQAVAAATRGVVGSRIRVVND